MLQIILQEAVQVPEQKCEQVEKEECYQVPRQVRNIILFFLSIPAPWCSRCPGRSVLTFPTKWRDRPVKMFPDR